MKFTKCRRVVGFTIGLAVTNSSVQAQEGRSTQRHVVVVTVRDSQTRAPLLNATVTMRGRSGQLLTDSSGAVVFPRDLGRGVVISARRLGYAPSTLEVRPDTADTVRVALVLTPTVQVLATVPVVGASADYGARLSAFEARRMRGASGSFITRSELEQWHSIYLTDALRRVQSVRIVDSVGFKFAASSRSAKPSLRGTVADLAPCIMRVGVDGQIKELGFAPDEVPVPEIEGVEVYAGPASLPAEFSGLRRDAGCGLVMIWTRSR